MFTLIGPCMHTHGVSSVCLGFINVNAFMGKVLRDAKAVLSPLAFIMFSCCFGHLEAILVNQLIKKAECVCLLPSKPCTVKHTRDGASGDLCACCLKKSSPEFIQINEWIPLNQHDEILAAYSVSISSTWEV
jgi:hypothetical protein